MKLKIGERLLSSTPISNMRIKVVRLSLVIGYINAVSLNTLAHLGLKHIPHLKPYSMSWLIIHP
jgi:hypothetical protein